MQNKVEGILVSILRGKGNREIELVGDEVGEDMSKVFVGETVMSALSGANWLCNLLPIRP